jgi:hypothetical protein
MESGFSDSSHCPGSSQPDFPLKSVARCLDLPDFEMESDPDSGARGVAETKTRWESHAASDFVTKSRRESEAASVVGTQSRPASVAKSDFGTKTDRERLATTDFQANSG